MLTTTESRVLYVLRKNNGQAKSMTISQAMARTSKAARDRALVSCENLDLISSAKTPPKGRGRGALVYWLTKAGKAYVQALIDSGQMKDPTKEPRAQQGEKRAVG